MSCREEISHVQCQRNPRKMVGTGAAVEETPHVQEQRRSPNKMVGGVNLHLEQTPFLPEMLKELKQTLCAPGLRDPTETETELYLSVSCGGMGQWWSATGTEALGVGMA